MRSITTIQEIHNIEGATICQNYTGTPYLAKLYLEEGPFQSRSFFVTMLDKTLSELDSMCAYLWTW